MVRHPIRVPKPPLNPLAVLTGILLSFCILIGVRLFYLQVLQYNFYQSVAAKAHFGYTELPARRGEIFLQDYHSGEYFRVATNTTLDLIYVDPTLIKNPTLVADALMPLLFHLHEEREKDNERLERERAELREKLSEEELEKTVKPLSDEELKNRYSHELLKKISERKRTTIILTTSLDAKQSQAITGEKFSGVEVKNGVLYLYPDTMDASPQKRNRLAELLHITADDIQKAIDTPARYVVLKRRLDPAISAKIRQLIRNDKNDDFLGIRLEEEFFRSYPEGPLAANAIGYVNSLGIGQYGIEASFNMLLEGKKGVFKTQKDSIGRQITVGQNVIQPPEDGDSIVLTIDRSIQAEIDRLLKEAVKEYRADGGQVLILEPSTGKIMAMSHAPSFDPGAYSEAFEKEEMALTEEQKKNLQPIDEKEGRYWLSINRDIGERIQVFKNVTPDGKEVFKKYKNTVGPDVYQNKIAAWTYEPGSIFKTVAMAAALDDNDVTPQTMFHDTGPIEVDEYTIHNATDNYYGLINMTTVIEKSLNTGMTFVARRIGRTLFYSYMKKFGFGERLDIEFQDEEPGKIEHFTKWAESELVTKAFGQGLSVTPLQMAASYAVIANNGVLMRPYIVEKIIKPNGKEVKTDPTPLRQVVSEKTANTMTAMLVSATENGVARNAKVAGHYMAAKTGTAQTYFRGKPLKGKGTTIASIVGFAPIDKPKFVILVKLDKPRTVEWADVTAAPLFSKISAFLFDYFNIPPDKKS